MSESALWFVALLAGGVAAFFAAMRLGSSRQRAIYAFGWLGLFLIALVWLQKHPATALALLPSHVLIHLEGTAVFPAAMAILGVAWAQGRRRRQRVLTGVAVVVAGMCFMHGARWMVQPTPSVIGSGEAVVTQSTDYSCVAAACATALNQLNVPTNEADMMTLARVKAGSGATMMRALDGLNRRLDQSPWRARLVDMHGGDALLTQAPALVALRLGKWNSHLVTIVESHEHYVVIADPVDGLLSFPRHALEAYAEPTGIVFERTGEAAARVALVTR